jgi:RNA polymerase sigma factor (sigma-70 family)
VSVDVDKTRRAQIQAWMVQLHEGDRSVFPALADALWPVVLAFARSAGGADAEDVAQEVFVRLCTRMAEFDPTRDGVSWVYGITAYEVRTHRRRHQRRREIGTSDAGVELVDPSRTAEERLAQEELVGKLTELVGQLTEADRAALDLEGANAGAGATQRKRKQRALERLRELWRGLHG